MQLGDSKEATRGRIRGILKNTGGIYPCSKVFGNLLEHGIQSKNSRTRSESMEELGSLLQRQGQSVCQPNKALPAIAALLSNKDAVCRSAALTALAHAHALMGDVIFKHIGDLADKERSMLDEKLIRSSLPPSNLLKKVAPVVTQSSTPSKMDSLQGASVRSDARAALGRSSGISRLPAGVGSNDRRSSTLPTLDQSSATSGNPPLQPRRESHLPHPRTANALKVPSNSSEMPLDTFASGQHYTIENAGPKDDTISPHTSIQMTCTAILSDRPDEAVDALKVIQRDIAHHPTRLAEQVDPIIEAVTLSMSKGFQGLCTDTPQATLRLCKHLMQTLSGFFDQKLLSVAVSQDALVTLLSELTKRLLETADSGATEAITSLSKVLNMVLIRIFHNADRSSCFGCAYDIDW